MVVVIPLPKKKTINKLIKKAARVGITLSIIAVPQLAWAGGLEALNREATAIYYTIASVGKWLIILKGALDAVQMTAAGDMQTLKKNMISYLGMFAMLLAFPWAMNWVEDTFNEFLFNEGVMDYRPVEPTESQRRV